MEQLRFDGKVALVTGAGRGLGRAYARLLAARGAQVVVNDIAIGPDGSPMADSPAEEVVAEIREAGGNAVADGHSVVDGAAAMVAKALDSFGRLDIVINNAGISGGGNLADIPPVDFDRMIDIHYRGTVAVIRESWKPLAAAGAGRIVNTSSSSVFGAPYTLHYASAKGAIYALTRGLAEEGKASGIQVNCVMPSAWTRLTSQVPNAEFQGILQKYFQPESIAPFVVWLCHQSNVFSGETFHIGGGRAGRVLLMEAQGVTAPDWTPEAWIGQEAELLNVERYGTPNSMLDSFVFEMQNISAETRGVMAQTDLLAPWKFD